MPSLRLRCVSGAAFYAAKVSLNWPLKGRNSTVVAAYCLHVDVCITTMWRLLRSCCRCWWIFSLVLPVFVLLWAECHPGKFHSLQVKHWAFSCLCLWRDALVTVALSEANTSPTGWKSKVKSSKWFLLTCHWLFGLTRIRGTGTTTVLSRTQKADSEWIVKQLSDTLKTPEYESKHHCHQASEFLSL